MVQDKKQFSGQQNYFRKVDQALKVDEQDGGKISGMYSGDMSFKN